MSETKKSFIIEISKSESGQIMMRVKNDGFPLLQLLGALAFAQADVMKQLCGEVKADLIPEEEV